MIKIEGLNLERFLNQCVGKEIYLWNIVRRNYLLMEANVAIQDFKAVKKLARKNGCRISLAKKYGYPFLAHRMKKRKMLFLGAFFSLIVLISASSFIYRIDVVGNETVETEEILIMLEENGFSVGSNRYRLNLRELEQSILLEFNELSWVGIEIKGIYATVEVVEKVFPPEIIEKDVPCHVVASKNGLIERVIARNGDAKVKEGDIVKPGDLLITGIVTRQFMNQPLYVHAYGEVYAKTYYDVEKSIDLVTIERIKTGQIHKRRRFQFGDLSLSLGGSDIPFEKYLVQEDKKLATLWRRIQLPVEIVEITYEEVYEEEKILPLNEAKELIHQEALNELMEMVPLEAELVRTIVDFQQAGQQLTGTFTMEVIEDIARQIKIENGED